MSPFSEVSLYRDVPCSEVSLHQVSMVTILPLGAYTNISCLITRLLTMITFPPPTSLWQYFHIWFKKTGEHGRKFPNIRPLNYMRVSGNPTQPRKKWCNYLNFVLQFWLMHIISIDKSCIKVKNLNFSRPQFLIKVNLTFRADML